MNTNHYQHSDSDKPKILIILHQENSTPGRVGIELHRRKFELDVRRPRFGDELPATLSEHVGVVVFGGPMSANDNEPYINDEIKWFDVPFSEQVPCLGICLGAQMMVRNLGGKVYSHNDEQVEIGYYPIWPTAPGKEFMNWPHKVYQWHREGFTLPKDTVLLAEGDTYPNQAFRFGPNAYGIQFHPELTLAMLYRWTTKGAPRMQLPGAQQREDHFNGRVIYDPLIKQWLVNFLDKWIGTAEDHMEDPIQIAAE